MKTMAVTEVARNFSSVMDGVESKQEEIVLIRNNKPVGRIIPEPPGMTALEIFTDLYCTLDNETADELLKGINKFRNGIGVEIRNSAIHLFPDLNKGR
jgi:antitoxin (DNA-binding transcriptional repressor) of toxin-antitoxin stability system